MKWAYDFSTLFLNESATSIKVSINVLKKTIARVLISAAPDASCIITTIIVAGTDAPNACWMIWFINPATYPFWLRELNLCRGWRRVEEVSAIGGLPTRRYTGIGPRERIEGEGLRRETASLIGDFMNVFQPHPKSEPPHR